MALTLSTIKVLPDSKNYDHNSSSARPSNLPELNQYGFESRGKSVPIYHNTIKDVKISMIVLNEVNNIHYAEVSFHVEKAANLYTVFSETVYYEFSTEHCELFLCNLIEKAYKLSKLYQDISDLFRS